MKYYALFKTTYIPLVCFPFILALKLLLKTSRKWGDRSRGVNVINQVLKSQQLEDHSESSPTVFPSILKNKITNVENL